jgi:hypothetical protein
LYPHRPMPETASIDETGQSHKRMSKWSVWERAFRCGRGQARWPAPTRSFVGAPPVGAQRHYPAPVAFPSGVVKKAKKNKRRFAPEGVRPLSPLPGHSPPPGGGEQASAEARFGRRRVRYPRPFGARRFRYFSPPRPQPLSISPQGESAICSPLHLWRGAGVRIGGEGGAKRRERGLFLAEQSDGSFY